MDVIVSLSFALSLIRAPGFCLPSPVDNHSTGDGLYPAEKRTLHLLCAALLHMIYNPIGSGLSTTLHGLERLDFTQMPIASEQDRFDPLIRGSPAVQSHCRLLECFLGQQQEVLLQRLADLVEVGE
jgi:hypothetical protein